MNFPWSDSRPVLVVPYLKDCNDFRKEEQVRQICRKCADQLSAHLFVWRKTFPSRSTIKTWCSDEKKFLGMDLSLFQDFIHNHFSVRTADNLEWLLDSKIADRIWSACIADDSPLPEANWDIEAERRKEGK